MEQEWLIFSDDDGHIGMPILADHDLAAEAAWECPPGGARYLESGTKEKLMGLFPDLVDADFDDED